MKIELEKMQTALCRIFNRHWNEKEQKFVKETQWFTKWKVNPVVHTALQIESHFKNTKDAAIAIMTGKEAGFLVIDFDTKNDELLTGLLSVCPTYCVKTTNGFHLYYQYRDDPILKEGTRRFGDSVDVRENGGAIFSPPTPAYEKWGDEDEIAELNEEAMEMLRYRATPVQLGSPKQDLKNTTTRNNDMYRRACGWINIYPKEEVFRRMAEANKEFHKGELSIRELEIIYQQAAKHDPEVKKAEEKKEEAKKYKFVYLSDVPEEKDVVRYSIGYSQFDSVLIQKKLIGVKKGGLAIGEFVAIAGRPKNGKTLFCAQIVASLAKQGLPILCISYEGSSSALKQVMREAGAPDKTVTIIECDDGESLNSRVDWIWEQLEAAQEQRGVKVLVIDNLDFLEVPSDVKSRDEYESMKIIIPMLAKKAVQYKIILILVAHVRKPTNTGGAPRRPYMYDIAGTSLVDRLCAIGFIVDRDKQSDGMFMDTTSVYLENNRPSGTQKKIVCLLHNGKLIDPVEDTAVRLGGKIIGDSQISGQSQVPWE